MKLSLTEDAFGGALSSSSNGTTPTPDSDPNQFVDDLVSKLLEDDELQIHCHGDDNDDNVGGGLFRNGGNDASRYFQPCPSTNNNFVLGSSAKEQFTRLSNGSPDPLSLQEKAAHAAHAPIRPIMGGAPTRYNPGAAHLAPAVVNGSRQVLHPQHENTLIDGGGGANGNWSGNGDAAHHMNGSENIRDSIQSCREI